MTALQLNGGTLPHPYASQSLIVTPNPPRVGEATTLALTMKNSGPTPLTIKRIEFFVAAFGVGVSWEQLPTIEQFTLPVDPTHETRAAIEWTPTYGGHRCVRALVHSDVLPRPLRIGRNLQVIEASADCQTWHIPFHLGNPEKERRPITLEFGNALDELEALVVVKGRLHRAGDPIWLNAGEETEAQIILKARTLDAIYSIKTVEAHIDGRFIDGIQVEVRRPAFIKPSRRLEDMMSKAARARQDMLVSQKIAV